jgi:diguanylate cyclase (GGDEF)-like protein
MVDEIIILERRLQREKNIRQQAERIAEEKSRALYLKSVELENALQAESKARKKIESLYKEVERLSRIDPLTELSNRRSFSAEAARFFKLGIRHQKELSCAMLDIDLFKKVNDTFGHDFGDRVLIEVANTCKKELRTTDLLARFGGEEFCFLFPETDLRGAFILAERIRIKISELQFYSEKNRFSVTASLGVAGLLHSDKSIEDVLKRSDVCLYKAKERGRDRVVVWEIETNF